jgi:hypothetical protein
MTSASSRFIDVSDHFATSGSAFRGIVETAVSCILAVPNCRQIRKFFDDPSEAGPKAWPPCISPPRRIKEPGRPFPKAAGSRDRLRRRGNLALFVAMPPPWQPES